MKYHKNHLPPKPTTPPVPRCTGNAASSIRIASIIVISTLKRDWPEDRFWKLKHIFWLALTYFYQFNRWLKPNGNDLRTFSQNLSCRYKSDCPVVAHYYQKIIAFFLIKPPETKHPMQSNFPKRPNYFYNSWSGTPRPADYTIRAGLRQNQSFERWSNLHWSR